MENFIDCLEDIYNQCYTRLNTVRDMVMTDDDLEDFKHSKKCGICLKSFEDDTVLKVPDHDHISGRYRSAAHSICNLQMRQQKSILIFMHNAKG